VDFSKGGSVSQGRHGAKGEDDCSQRPASAAPSRKRTAMSDLKPVQNPWASMHTPQRHFWKMRGEKVSQTVMRDAVGTHHDGREKDAGREELDADVGEGLRGKRRGQHLLRAGRVAEMTPISAPPAVGANRYEQGSVGIRCLVRQQTARGGRTRAYGMTGRSKALSSVLAQRRAEERSQLRTEDGQAEEVLPDRVEGARADEACQDD
jgi:hypothetical protein